MQGQLDNTTRLSALWMLPFIFEGQPGARGSCPTRVGDGLLALLAE